MAETDSEPKSKDDVYYERNLNSLALLSALSELAAERGVDAEMGYWHDTDDVNGEAWAVVWVNLDSVSEVLETDPDRTQVGWHLPAEMVPEWLDERDPEYDGYSTETKNERLGEYIYE